MELIQTIRAEIERRKKHYLDRQEYDLGWNDALEDILSFLDTLESGSSEISIDNIEEDNKPEYGYLETTYYRGKKPRWCVGDTLAYYEFNSDIEGEAVLGEIVKIGFSEEENDWFYTLGDCVYFEEELLEEEVYKKN